MFNLKFPPATAAKVYSPQELTKDLAKYHSSKTPKNLQKILTKMRSNPWLTTAGEQGDRCLAENVFLTSFSGKHTG